MPCLVRRDNTNVTFRCDFYLLSAVSLVDIHLINPLKEMLRELLFNI